VDNAADSDLKTISFRYSFSGKFALIKRAAPSLRNISRSMLSSPINRAPMHLVDIGANLAHESFGRDLDDVLARARAAGVETIVITGSCAASNETALQLAQQHRGIYCTAGVHPHHAETWNAALGRRIAQLAALPDVVAVGECGLDYYRDLAPRPTQRAAFIAQLELAIAAEKPVFLHQRDAHADFIAILRDYRNALRDCIVHCFTDIADALDDYLALDCYIGITGWICDERRGAHLLDSVRAIPDDRLLIETDSPYLLPRTLKPAPKDRRNEPAFLPWVAQTLALARDEAVSEIAEKTHANACRVFKLYESDSNL
jgi:TatD DNase family protein